MALEYVARGEAPFGIVYATDAEVAPSVHVVGFFRKIPSADYLSGRTDQDGIAGGAGFSGLS